MPWPRARRIGPMHFNVMFLAASSGSSQALVGLLPFLLIFVVFYVLLIVPQQRQRRKTQEMLSNLKSGDKVVTSGGIYGTIVEFRDSVVQLQIAPQVRVEISRSAIAGLQPDESDGAKSSEGARRKT
jgi:preprotein translocase subunit YajC